MTRPRVDAAPPTRLIYLHGFRSSPRSAKAQQLRRHLAAWHPQVRFECPRLPPSPRDAMREIEALADDGAHARTAIVGSSLGGFYATALARSTGWPTVVVNPAVDPARDLADHVGELSVWGSPGTTIHFGANCLDELRAIAEPPPWTPLPNLLAVIASGDEVLDWRSMWARHEGSARLLVVGGDHGLAADFERLLPRVLRFVGLG